MGTYKVLVAIEVEAGSSSIARDETHAWFDQRGPIEYTIDSITEVGTVNPFKQSSPTSDIERSGELIHSADESKRVNAPAGYQWTKMVKGEFDQLRSQLPPIVMLHWVEVWHITDTGRVWIKCVR